MRTGALVQRGASVRVQVNMPYEARQSRRVAIGLLLTAAIMAAIVLVFFSQAIVDAARGTYEIVVIFYEAPRLRGGSMVQLAGFRVGEVTKIEVLPPNDTMAAPFAATVRVPERVSAQLRRDSRARLRRNRPMGEPIVDLIPGTPYSPVLRPGETLYASPPVRAGELVALGKEVRSAIDSFFMEEKAIRGSVALLAERSDRIRREMMEISAAFARLESHLDDGPLPEFLADPGWRESLTRMGGLIDEIERLVRARAATVDETEALQSVEALELRIGEIRAAVARLGSLLEESGGFPGRWEYDPALREAIAATRAQLDSLIEITRRRPWRYFF